MGFLPWKRGAEFRDGLAVVRQVRLAAAVGLFSLLFDIARYLKGYAGGLVIRPKQLVYRLSRGDPMMRVSASLFVGSRE